MKLTLTTFVCIMAAGLASAQSPSIIQNTRTTMNGVSNNATAASNQALGIQPASTAGTVASQAPATSSGVSAATPVKVHSTKTKHKGGAKRVPGSAVAQGSIVAIPKSSADEGENTGRDQEAPPNTKYNANGRRDPFLSPVVTHAGGSGCSTGKKCLEIGAVNLRGVVRSENGFIAVVSNGLNKAYFLRENDPVFNGYVMKITGDSIVFQETLQDRLGKSFTREVVKKITTPAV
jgi:hypothetical protein